MNPAFGAFRDPALRFRFPNLSPAIYFGLDVSDDRKISTSLGPPRNYLAVREFLIRGTRFIILGLMID